MKPYSLDLRERVIAALEESQLTQPQIADKYDLSLRTVELWAHQWRATGNINPRPPHSGPQRTLQACGAVIQQAVASQPDLTLAELCAAVITKTQIRGSLSMMCRELQILKLPRKKITSRQSTRNAARPTTAQGLSRTDTGDTPRPRRPSQVHR